MAADGAAQLVNQISPAQMAIIRNHSGILLGLGIVIADGLSGLLGYSGVVYYIGLSVQV
jgi:hypothetical protein